MKRSNRLLLSPFETEQTLPARDKVELKNIAIIMDMDSHRRTNCAVQPSGPARKWSTARKPSTSKLENFDRQTIQSFRDADAAKKYFKRRTKMLSCAACIMGLFTVAFAFVDIELTIRGIADTSEDLSPNDLQVILNNPYRLAAVVVKSLLSVLSLLTSITIYQMNVNELKYLVVKNIYHESEKFVMTSLFPSCLLEVAVCLFHVPPLLDYYGMPYKLQLLVFLRLYLIAKYVREHNMFVDNQATALFASVTQTEISSIFLVKAYFLKFPFRLILTFYLLNIFLGGYFVHVIERTHNTYLDTVWMLVVTMTTLGFGDVVPKAVLARAFVGFASVLGIFLMALFISVVHEALQLKQQEKRILATMENADHHNKKKNLAATCIQSTWRLYHFIKLNPDTIEWGDWFKTQKLRMFQHKLAEDIRKWRVTRRSWSRDDYWKKFFLADDIAMLLTDVARSVGNVENFLQKQNGGRRISKSSFKRSSVISPPPIAEEEVETPALESSQTDKTRKVHAVLVDSWTQPSNNQPSSPRSFNSHQGHSSSSTQYQFVNPSDKCSNGYRNYTSYGKVTEMGDNSRVTLRPRKESDPIDRGEIPADALHGKVESLESALDQIYYKMKTDLRDVRDSLKSLNRYSDSSSTLLSPLPLARTNNNTHSFSYSRTTDHVHV